MHMPVTYLKTLTPGRAVLWCYLIWYFVMAGAYFDPSPRMWLTSAGLGLVIGFALILSVVSTRRTPWPDRWQIFRLFLVPFCVSSFSALVKDRGLILIFSPEPGVTGLALALCAGFLALVGLIR
ncbi:MAG: hypothetical protein HY017_27000 [Betaproteobacteria bacterium]|nr:hypothetical protein [Betaproteobacteria bacterium]